MALQTQNHVHQTPYKPVSCDFSDELEALSTRKKSVRFKIETSEGKTEWKVGQIEDLYARDHADYLKMRDGTEIRLDKIVEWQAEGK